jgi:hypothetical protein
LLPFTTQMKEAGHVHARPLCTISSAPADGVSQVPPARLFIVTSTHLHSFLSSHVCAITTTAPPPP